VAEAAQRLKTGGDFLLKAARRIQGEHGKMDVAGRACVQAGSRRNCDEEVVRGA
jgi:hypothetical protein